MSTSAVRRPRPTGSSRVASPHSVGRFAVSHEVRVVPDTSALMDAPDLTIYWRAVGVRTFTVHLLPQVLVELDGLKVHRNRHTFMLTGAIMLLGAGLSLVYVSRRREFEI